MRIGIDVATLALNRQVDLIVVASNDTELIPAFKLSRRHGVQVAVAKVGSFTPHMRGIKPVCGARQTEDWSSAGQ